MLGADKSPSPAPLDSITSSSLKLQPVMSTTPHQPKPYTSHLSLPYTTSPSPLLTLDVHIPTSAPSPSSQSFSLIYIHGGAFRDPLITSLSLLPSLSSIFSPPGRAAEREKKKISIVASLNYRLSPYPAHFSHPSSPVGVGVGVGGNEDRNVIWPTHLDDVLKGIHFLFSSSLVTSLASTNTSPVGKAGEREEEEEGGIILCGHSVGGTLAVHAAAALLAKASEEGNNNIPPVRAVVSLAGIFNFKKCRDAHEPFGHLFDAFLTAAFGGPDEIGRWAVADLYSEPSDDDAGKTSTLEGEGGGGGNTVVEVLKREGRGVVVVLGYSKEDELVEGEQGEGLATVLLQGRGQKEEEGGLRVRLVECNGGHGEIVDRGVEIGRCVGVAVDMLLGEVGQGVELG